MSKTPSKQKQRHNARQAAIQALYQWQYTAPSATELIHHFLLENTQDVLDVDYFKALVSGTINDMNEIDTHIKPILDRDIKDINSVELAILRISTYELIHQPSIPFRVVINEALKLAKEFGAEQSHKYINAILDKLATKLRNSEILKK